MGISTFFPTVVFFSLLAEKSFLMRRGYGFFPVYAILYGRLSQNIPANLAL